MSLEAHQSAKGGSRLDKPVAYRDREKLGATPPQHGMHLSFRVPARQRGAPVVGLDLNRGLRARLLALIRGQNWP